MKYQNFDCQLSDFTVSPIGDSTHVKVTISLVSNVEQHWRYSWSTSISTANFEFMEILGHLGEGVATCS